MIDIKEAGVFIGAVLTLFAFVKKVVIPMFKKGKVHLGKVSKMVELATNSGEVLDLLRDVASSVKGIQRSTESIELEIFMSAERFKSLVNLLDIGIWEADDNGSFIYVNRMLLAMTGYSQERMLGNGWISSISEEDRERVREEWFQSVKDKREMNIHFAFINMDGGKVDVRAITSPIKSKNGSIVNFIGKCIAI